MDVNPEHMVPKHMSQNETTEKQKLHAASVHVSGTGRVGTNIVLNLAAGGVQSVTANDGQRIDQENLGNLILARPSDLGREKVFVLERALHGLSHFVFEPVFARTQSDLVDPYIERATVVISCANTVAARLAAERKAIRYGKPVIQVAAFDGKERLGGLITLRLPENAWSACFGCYLNGNRRFPRGEALLSTVTATLAAVASNLAVEIISGARADFMKTRNLLLIDLETYRIEALAVERRAKCRVCGDASSVGDSC